MFGNGGGDVRRPSELRKANATTHANLCVRGDLAFLGPRMNGRRQAAGGWGARKFPPMGFANMVRPFPRPESGFFRHRFRFLDIFDQVATKTRSWSGKRTKHIRKVHR